VSRLEERRLEFEGRLEDLRRALTSELGWTPRGAWVLPVAALAAGLAAALWLRRGRRRRLAGEKRRLAS
jgi:hypothetical protein